LGFWLSLADSAQDAVLASHGTCQKITQAENITHAATPALIAMVGSMVHASISKKLKMRCEATSPMPHRLKGAPDRAMCSAGRIRFFAAVVTRVRLGCLIKPDHSGK
jgi:hypothetical protein